VSAYVFVFTHTYTITDIYVCDTYTCATLCVHIYIHACVCVFAFLCVLVTSYEVRFVRQQCMYACVSVIYSHIFQYLKTLVDMCVRMSVCARVWVTNSLHREDLKRGCHAAPSTIAPPRFPETPQVRQTSARQALCVAV